MTDEEERVESVRVKAVIVDLDGTILDVSERDAFARHEALNSLGYTVSLDEVKQHYRHRIGLTGILKELNISLTQEEVKDYLNARFSSFTKKENASLHQCVIGVMRSDPNNLVCIGDSVGELEPAKKLGMTTIGVLTGISRKKDLERVSDFTIRDITQVNDVLSRMDR